MSQTQQVDADLKDKFEKVGYDTIGGQTCQATVTGIDERRGSVRVSVELPSGRDYTERFDIPEVNSDRYEFVRLLNGLGYDLITVEGLVGSSVEVEFNDDGPSISVPERERSARERLSDSVPAVWLDAIMSALILLCWPVVFPSVFPKWHDWKWGWEPNLADWLGEGIILGFLGSALAWTLIGSVIHTLLTL